MKHLLHTLVLLALASLASCRQSCQQANINRLDRTVATWSEIPSSERAVLLDSLAPGFKAWLTVIGQEETSLSDSAITALSSTPGVTIFGPDVDSILPSLSDVEMQLGSLRNAIEHEFPDVKFPNLYGIIATNNAVSIYRVGDDVALIALNHYLGPDYPGYRSFEAYRTRLKQPQRIPIDLAEALIASTHPFKQSESAQAQTLLDCLLYDGAITVTLSRLLPDVDECKLLGFTDDEWKWLRENELPGWQSMVQRDMIYSTDPLLADRMLLPAPTTTALHRDAPGRAGRYYGYRIVKKYLDENPDTPLTQLLSPEFYLGGTQTLQNSKYTGR